MKKRMYIWQCLLLSLALFGLAACQQNEMGEDTLLKQMQLSAPMVSRSISCEITTTKPGQLGSLLTVKAKEGGYQTSELTDLTISGPISIDDIDRIRNFKYLQTINLTNARFWRWTERDGYLELREVDEVPSGMFESLRSPAVILLPGYITCISVGAFMFSDITSITIPDGVTELNLYAFKNCRQLTKVKLPNSLVKIRESAFESCSALTKINLPNGLIEIEKSAFKGSGLTEIKIPESVMEIGSNVLSGCKSLINVDWPSTIHTIPDYAFDGCTNLQMTIPDHITTIGNGAFRKTASPAKLTIPENVEFIGYEVFNECGMSSVYIKGKLSSLSAKIFSGCDNLKTVEIGGTVKSIGEYAFSGCNSLQEILLPKGLEKIHKCAFAGCDSLQRISLPEGLKNIGHTAFDHTALTTLTIPSSVTSCDDYILSECKNLTSVFWNASIPIPKLSSTNNNLLVYAKENVWSDESNGNVIYDGHAAYITLTSDRPFFCPQSFTADVITYTMSFPTTQQSDLDAYGNWKSIALPFTATTIVQKNNHRPIAPFNAGVEGASPFWLRELTAEGFVNATQIEANKGYIISMPNSKKYDDQYNITGDVIFSASGNVEIPATEPIVSVGPNYSLHPTFSVIPKAGQIWGLNESKFYDSTEGKTYSIGSVFVANQRVIQPFEAYLTSSTSSRMVWPVVLGSTQTRSNRIIGPIPMIDDM